MNRNILFWLLATLITISSAVYQRVTGPTFPVNGKYKLDGIECRYSLPTSHESVSDCEVKIETLDSLVGGLLSWRRFGAGDSWTVDRMRYRSGALTASLPHQPPAGKLEYFVVLLKGSSHAILPSGTPAEARFKGPVPASILIIHIIAMFAGMLVSTRAGIAALARETLSSPLTCWTASLLFAGGLVLGPIVQHYAFGSFWTGWPVGHDLTDNKTAIAVVMWMVSAFSVRKGKDARWIIFWSAVVTIFVYLVPHSLFGSQLDYSNSPPG